jgi:tRNA(adenine34) deaminase
MVMLAKTDGQKFKPSAIDIAMMRRCIALSATAITRGEFPFAAVICEGDDVVVEATNDVVNGGDVTRHAEIIAISRAQKKLGRKDLSSCTLYSNVEPCAMCSFPMRETSIARVVFAISSPMMGGHSKWNVLRDSELSRAMPEAFGPPPEIIAGLLRQDAEKVWWTWNPLIWSVIRHRGCFGRESTIDGCDHLPALPERPGLLPRLLRTGHIHRSAKSADAFTLRGLPALAGRLSSVFRGGLAGKRAP